MFPLVSLFFLIVFVYIVSIIAIYLRYSSEMDSDAEHEGIVLRYGKFNKVTQGNKKKDFLLNWASVKEGDDARRIKDKNKLTKFYHNSGFYVMSLVFFCFYILAIIIMFIILI
jgi:hypothetical protein